MTSGRVLAIAALLTSSCAFAQQSSNAEKSPDIKEKGRAAIAEVNPGVPNLLNPADAVPSLLPPVATPANENVNVCFKMRTYVMARDSKNSDSTHLVRYTTCTPANARVVQKTARPADDH